MKAMLHQKDYLFLLSQKNKHGKNSIWFRVEFGKTQVNYSRDTEVII